MSDEDMATRLKNLRTLVTKYEQALQSFKTSNSKFKILDTIQPSRRSPKDDGTPQTLLILDSSFNPPSIAHQSLANSVLEHPSIEAYPGPRRLLLLFSTMNADKAPSAASFPQRLVMMRMLAEDLVNEHDDDDHDTGGERPRQAPVCVDIGVTTAPYYTDKSQAIERDGREAYPDRPRHVHLLGFDTLTRIFTAKYYKDHDPPFSALDSYFDAGHQLRVTLRPDGDYGSVEQQQAFTARLSGSDMAKEGAKAAWARQIELVPPNPKAGVSSTKIRQAAKAGDWKTVKELCTPSVAAWVEEEKVYVDDDRGAKMA